MNEMLTKYYKGCFSPVGDSAEKSCKIYISNDVSCERRLPVMHFSSCLVHYSPAALVLLLPFFYDVISSFSLSYRMQRRGFQRISHHQWKQ